MLSRRTRVGALLTGALLLLAPLSACGGKSSGSSSSGGKGLDAVTVTGSFGADPQVKWNDKATTKTTQTKVLIAGTGPKVTIGSNALFNVWLGNGTTKQAVLSTFPGSKLTGGAPAQPTQAMVSSQMFKALQVGLENQAVGSRVLVVAPPADAFGTTGNPQLKIGAADDVVFVIDVVSDLKPLTGTSGSQPSWAPKVVESGLKYPTALDFKGVAKPDGSYRQTTLIQGTGATVKPGMTIWVRYLGQVYGAAKPFNQTYAGDPFSTVLKGNTLIHGWVRGLQGQKVGSRVLLQIPPKLGYGPKGNKQAGIKGTDTLYFVIDLLAAS